MKSAIFLDRDGVINRKAPEGEYILRAEELEILPGVPRAIRRLNEAGYLLVIVTNQRCIAKGLLSEAGLESIHQALRAQLSAAGARIDAIYFCPHESGVQCDCRKPEPGMLLRAAAEHQVHLASSWMIGDDPRDIEAGESAGCRTIRIASGGREALAAGASTRVAASLSEAADQILRQPLCVR